jgi:hypothetical protein
VLTQVGMGQPLLPRSPEHSLGRYFSFMRLATISIAPSALQPAVERQPLRQAGYKRGIRQDSGHTGWERSSNHIVYKDLDSQLADCRGVRQDHGLQTRQIMTWQFRKKLDDCGMGVMWRI